LLLGLTWDWLVKLHLDKGERLAILDSSLPTGEGRFGLTDSSRALYCKPLSALTDEEAAELIALVMQRGLSKRPSQLVTQAGKLLGKLGE
jgi:hypothetical protein